MPFASCNGARIHYQVDGDGPPIVFAHGGEGTHLHWWQQVEHFRHRYRCITYDARGFALSSGEPGDAGTEGHWRDLVALLDHLDIDRAALVGQSMGGWAVSGTALNAPERATAIVMADTPFNFATPALAEWAATMIDKIVGGFDVIAACTAPRFEIEQPKMAHLFRALCRLNRPRTGPRGISAYEQFRDQPAGDYRNFPVPALFIVGDEDALTVPPLIRATAAAVGGAQLVEVAGSGHSVYFERPDAFNRAVAEFLDSIARVRAFS